MISVEVLMILVAIFSESAEFKLSLTLGETADDKILKIKLGLLMMPRLLLFLQKIADFYSSLNPLYMHDIVLNVKINLILTNSFCSLFS